jgi:hypothetical protein
MRRLGNPLFPTDRRRVAAAELRAAQNADARDQGVFKKQVDQHISRGISQDASRRNVSEYFRQTLELLERAAAIGGDLAAEVQLLEQTAVSSKQWLIEDISDGHATELLNRYEALSSVRRIPLLAECGRADSPISKDECTRALLCEEDWILDAAAMAWGGLMGIKLLDEATDICAEAVREGYPAVDSSRKLGRIKAAIARGLQAASQNQQGTG